MRKFLFALALCFITTPALAQNTTCSDRPPNDSSNACANTRFVQNHPIVPGSISLPNGQILVGSGSGVATAVNMSGGCTISNLGVISCDAGQLTGTLPSSVLPSPFTNGTATASSGPFARSIGTLGSGCAQWNGAGQLIDTGSSCGGGYNIGAYGAKCDGVTDDTTAIQTAWNAAAAAHSNLKVSGVGNGLCLFSSITQPAPVQTTLGSLPPFVSQLIGDGPSSVQLISTVTGTNCAINITTPYNTYQPSGTMGGFTLIQSGKTAPSAGGRGICLNNVTQYQIDNIFISYFTIGIAATDTINLRITNSSFVANDIHIRGQIGTQTRPNAWTIATNQFSFSQQYAIDLVNPAVINIQGNTFENSGQNLASNPATIAITGQPLDGSFGVNIQGNYFEFDNAIAVQLQSLTTDARVVSNNVSNNTFIRNSPNQPYMIYIVNGSTSGGFMSNNILGNSFLDVSPFSPSAATPYIFVLNASTANYQIMCLGNTYNTGTEMTTRCQIPGASATWVMDSGAHTGGP